ncbi:MAG: hypothetical protein ACTH69_03770 [Halomonas sp.]|uniref:hypothetical protein n=1 Tax=Halomonas sp. TaxID=1486246 RepID=UPI003F915A43
MSNKLVPVIIDNPCQKGWGYRVRDTIITLATLALWVLVVVKMYMFFFVEEEILGKLYDSVMIKMVLIGFVVTFLTFHCWAVYNQFLYTRLLKRQLRHMQPTMLETDNKWQSEMEGQIQRGQIQRGQIHEQVKAVKTN